MIPRKCRKSSSLLVKGIKLIVDQSQLLGVRHLVLLLISVRLPRLLDALAARHDDSMDLRVWVQDRSDRVFLSKRAAKIQDRWQNGNECVVAIELGPCVRALVSANAIYWSSDARMDAGIPRLFLKIFYRVSLSLSFSSSNLLFLSISEVLYTPNSSQFFTQYVCQTCTCGWWKFDIGVQF